MARSNDIHTFLAAARSIRNRISRVAFTKWLCRSHWIAGGIGLALVVALRVFWEWRSGEWLAVSGLLLLWLGIGVVLAIAARTNSLKSLAIFDHAGGWNDRFSSALAFLSDDSRAELTTGECLHIKRTKRELKKALPRLSDILPSPSLKKVWILPLLSLLLAATPALRKTINPGDALLTEEMIASANAEAERIRKAARDLDGLKALSSEEQVALQELEKSIDIAAGEITDPEGQSTRDVLSTLESRARAAERLAERLGLDGGDWASEEFVRELSQHADTADLAIGIKDKNSELIATQADSIAKILYQENLKRETTDRFTIALERSVAKAKPEDLAKPVGEHIGNAAGQMADRQPETAAKEFEQLANHFRSVSQREEAHKKLEKLAAQLRNSGSQISGSKLESLQKIDTNSSQPLPDGLQPVEAMPIAQQLQNLMAPQIPTPGEAGDQSMPIPGSLSQTPDGNQPDGQSSETGKGPRAAPVPGQSSKSDGSNSPQNLAVGPQSTSAPGSQGLGGLLSAPIPGASGMEVPGSNLGGGEGTSAAAGGGGDKAGSATIAMFEQEDELSKANQESLVAAQQGNEGDSEFRAVEGQSTREEQAKLRRNEIVRTFLDGEEAALDEATLPLTRRNQVLRYFSEIRRQLETEEP